MADSHSASVSPVSRIKSCRCEIKLVITCLNLGSDAPSSLASTASVNSLSVRSSIIVLPSFQPGASDTFEQRRDTLPDPDAHGRKGVPRIALL